MTHNIYLVHEGANLASSLRKALENGKPVTPLIAKAVLNNQEKKGEVIVIPVGNDWDHALGVVREMKQSCKSRYAIFSSPTMLRKTIAQFEESSGSKGSSKGLPPTSKNKKNTQKQRLLKPEELSFDELIEVKLAQFVKKIRQGEGKNLYDLLIQEVEKPLIKLALKETGGNQVQASQLLGMHRNTLRKKMKDLKIRVEKKRSC
ncbi:MAG: helix-turn-helix domain-containing protein [Nitrospiria bacterium]